MGNEKKEALRKSMTSILRAVLVSAPEGIMAHEIESEYKEVSMQSLPYEELGYKDHLAMIRDLPDVARIETDSKGQTVVKAVPSKEDSHIAKLVSGQKKPKPKKSRAQVKLRQAATFKNAPIVGNKNAPSLISNKAFGQHFQYNDHITRSNFRHSFNEVARINNFLKKHPVKNDLAKSRSKASLPTYNSQKGQKKSNRIKETKIPVTDLTQDDDYGDNNMPWNRDHTYNEGYTEEEKEKVIQNLIKLLGNVPNGLWDFVLINKYKSVYKEKPILNLNRLITEEMEDIVEINQTVSGKAIFSLKKEILTKPESSSSVKQKDINEASDAFDIVDPDCTGNNKTSIVIAEFVRQKLWNGRQVTICHIDNICKFYVQDPNAKSRIWNLGTMLQNFYTGSKSEKYHIKSPRIGMFCCGQNTEDNCWRRGKVLSLQRKGSESSGRGRLQSHSDSLAKEEVISCRVLYVDYGNQEILQLQRIRELKAEFVELPAQAVLCQLGSILPNEGNNWSQEEIKYFKDLTDDSVFRCEVIKQEGNCLNIDLVTEDGRSISSEIVNSGHAVFSPLFKQSVTDSTERSEFSTDSPQKNRPPPLLQRLSSFDFESPESLAGNYVEPPSEEYVDVFVSNINSAADFSVIIDGHDHYKRLELLEKSMLEFFDDPHLTPPKSVTCGGVYAAFSVDGWYRCEVIGVENKIELHFLDHGDKNVVPLEEIRSLPSAFLRLPFQALSCALYNLPYEEDKELNEKFKELALGKVFVAAVIARNPKLYLELLDTSSSEDMSINKELLLLKPEWQSLEPHLPKAEEDMRVKAYIVFISDNGVINLQLPGPGYDQLERIICEAKERFSKGSKAADFVKTPEVGTMCFAKGVDNVSWYRARVVGLLKDREVELEFTDYGDKAVVSKNSLRAAGVISNAASTLPPQVVKCELADWPLDNKVSWTNDLIEQLMDQLDKKAVWVQTIKDAEEESLPQVHLYRTRDDGSVVERTVTEELLESLETGSNSDQSSERGSCSGTDSLTEEKTKLAFNLDKEEKKYAPDTSATSPEVFSQTTGGPVIGSIPAEENEITTPCARESPTSEVLSSNSGINYQAEPNHKTLLQDEEFESELSNAVPDLLFSDTWVDVIVVYTKSPHLFVIQQYSSLPAIDEMHKEMKEFYKDSISDLKAPPQNRLLAVYRSCDDIWYRGLVRSKGLEDKVCVEYVDYGNVEIVPVNKIRRLAIQFCKLPFQGVRVRLAGIKPKSRTWRRKGVYEFQKLVESRVLVAKILTDHLTVKKPIQLSQEPIKVVLYDTSDSDNDVNIAHRLAEGDAIIDTGEPVPDQISK